MLTRTSSPTSFGENRNFKDLTNMIFLGRSCGQVVSVLDFYYDDPSSNPAKAYS